MNTATLGGKTVYDPPRGLAQVNYFQMFTGVGRYGFGQFLLRRSDYDAIVSGLPAAGTTTLKLTSDGTPGLTLTVVVGAATPAVTSTGSDRTRDMVIVNVYDRRCRFTTQQLKAYNVQLQWMPGGANLTAADCYTSTVFAGSAGNELWTWARLINDLFGSGTSLPFTPATEWRPRNLVYDNVPVGRMLDDICTRLRVIAGYDHQAHTFTLHDPGSEGTANTSRKAAAAKYLIGGQDSVQSPKRLPRILRVTFPGFGGIGAYNFDYFESAGRVYEVIVVNSNGATGVEEAVHLGEYVRNWDATNQTELTNIANSFAPRHLASLKQTDGSQEFAGIWPFTPDGKNRAIRWISGPDNGPPSWRGARTVCVYGGDADFDEISSLRYGVESASNMLVAGMGVSRASLGSSGMREFYTAQPVGFWAKIGDGVFYTDNRWTYPFTEQIRTLVGFDNMPGGRTGTSINSVESFNASTGIMGNSVDHGDPGYPSGFALQPVRGGAVVWMHEDYDGGGHKIYTFQYENAEQGSCS